MRIGTALGFILLCGCGVAAKAADAMLSLSELALNPPASPLAPSIWSGFYVGTEVFGVSGTGKGSKGGFGGAAEVGYNHELDNNVVLGVNTSIGYAPSTWRGGRYSGFDFATANVLVGYDMGRVMPYVTGGIALEKPHTGPGAGYTGTSDAVNGLFSGASDLKAAGSIGVGAEYAITNNLRVFGEVSMTSRNPFNRTGPGGFPP